MPAFLSIAVIGVAGGLIASYVMTAYQRVTGSAFGMGGGGDPSNVKAADSVSEAVEGRPVTQKHRAAAGTAMHYAAGVLLGLVYVWLVSVWPVAAIAFGAGFGLVTMVGFDYLLVPVMGWGPWPSAAIGSNLYSFTSHVVFGVALEGVRRLGWAVLG